MKKKMVQWLLGILVAIVIILVMDKIKQENESMPPEPHFTIDGKEVQARLGDYQWNKKMKKALPEDELVYDINEFEIDPFSRLKINFDEKPKSVEVGEFDYYSSEDITFEPYNNREYPISNLPGRHLMIIKAKFDDGIATYVTKLSVKPSLENDPLDRIHEDVGNLKLPSVYSHVGLEQAQQQYPDLKIAQVPSYFLFDEKNSSQDKRL